MELMYKNSGMNNTKTSISLDGFVSVSVCALRQRVNLLCFFILHVIMWCIRLDKTSVIFYDNFRHNKKANLLHNIQVKETTGARMLYRNDSSSTSI